MAKYLNIDKFKIYDNVTHEFVSISKLEGIENADVIEIVRCKDCKHARNYDDSQHHSWLYCENPRATDSGYNEGYYYIEDDFFCADGERRESDAEK